MTIREGDWWDGLFRPGPAGLEVGGDERGFESWSQPDREEGKKQRDLATQLRPEGKKRERAKKEGDKRRDAAIPFSPVLVS